MAAGMGEGPITYGEIESCIRLTGLRLTSWDVETLRALSGEYIAEKHRASKMGCKPPWASPDLPYEASANQLAAREAAAEAANDAGDSSPEAKERERRNALKRERKK